MLSYLGLVSTLICIAGNLESYRRVASKLKLGTFEDEYTENINSVPTASQQGTGDTDAAGQVKSGEQDELIFSQSGLLFYFSIIFLLWNILILPIISFRIYFLYPKRKRTRNFC